MSGHLLHVLPRFLTACLVLAALPGPASVLCLHRTLRDGRTAGLAAAAGNEIGVLGWALAGGTGLSVLLTASHALSAGVHVIGGLTLVALGLQAWRSARPASAGEPGPAATGRLLRGHTPAAAFRASLVSIAANPKAAVFAISFLPQFLPRSGPLIPALVTLAGIQVLVDSAWTAGLVLLADRIGAIWRRAAVRHRVERALGAVSSRSDSNSLSASDGEAQAKEGNPRNERTSRWNRAGTAPDT
jgi:threonine/homoserine/homoserine lactone efflux protein